MKHRRRGVKREHSVIGDFAAVYEQLARLPGVAGVIPGRIASNPTHHPGLVLKVETPTGFKLFAKTTTSIQEVFVITRQDQREAALEALAGVLTRRPRAQSRGGPEPGQAGQRPRRGRPAAALRRPGRVPWRNPGILPAAPWRQQLVRYAADGRGHGGWESAGATVAEGLRDAATRWRLLVLRLRRARWRRRFGAARRRVPLPPGRPKGGN